MLRSVGRAWYGERAHRFRATARHMTHGRPARGEAADRIRPQGLPHGHALNIMSQKALEVEWRGLTREVVTGEHRTSTWRRISWPS